MAGKVVLSFLDASGETGRVAYSIPDVTAANLAASLDQSVFATAGGLAAAIASLSLCTPVGTELVANNDKLTPTPPGSLYAQREIGLMVSYADNVNAKKYRITIPGPDWANIGLAGSDQIDPNDAAWTAFKTAFETHAVSPDGNAVTVTGGQLVGRNR